MWAAVLAAADKAGDRVVATHARLRLAAVACEYGRHADAEPLVDQCVSELERKEDHAELTTALYWRAICATNLGAFDDACGYARRAMEIARKSGDRHGELMALRVLGLSIARLPGGHDDGIAYCEQALAIARESAQPACERELLHTVTYAYTLAGRCLSALNMCQQGIELDRQLGFPDKESVWLGVLGDAYYGLGRYGEAADAYTRALAGYRDQFLRRHYALCQLKLGKTYQAMGRMSEAISHLEQSLALFRELHLPHYEERARQTLSLCQDDQSVGQSAVPSQAFTHR